ncbi:YtxH domain-containing protein [Aeribacillus alveayuensis]|uniref:Gas vesicle protein n=1 Tax=Aeribacillus alveayuensis TaxID=279215 RepID=A0ABT9VRL8_9BACI|nr:gas vesicle protein [Bacillus alveayuensis]
MGNKNKLLKGVLLGALVGAAISLLDKKTRDHIKDIGIKTTEQMKHYVQNPSEASNAVKNKISEAKQTLRHVSDDLSFINEKVKELKELTPQLIELIEETKERIQKNYHE